MSNNIEQDQLIDRYIKGQMSVSELSEFETLLINDSVLLREVELQTAIAKAIYKKNMLKVVGENNNEVIKHQFTRKTILQITSFASAACLAGILLFSHFYQQHKYNQLSNEYYEPYQSVYDLPSRGDALAMNSSDSLVLDGIKLIKEGKTEKAIDQLTIITQKPTSLQYIGADVAQWYLALANLKEGNKKGAVMILKGIINSNESSSYKKQAKELLDKL